MEESWPGDPRHPQFFSTNVNLSALVWLQEGDALSLDPHDSLGGPQSVDHWVDPHLQLTNLGSMHPINT